MSDVASLLSFVAGRFSLIGPLCDAMRCGDVHTTCRCEQPLARGLTGVQLIISDACRGLIEAVGELYPDARWQRCVVHWYRNAFSHTPNNKVADVARMLKAIHAQEDRASAAAKINEVVAKLRALKLTRAAELVANHGQETLTYFAFPSNHWRQIRTNNPLERCQARSDRAMQVRPNDETSALRLRADA